MVANSKLVACVQATVSFNVDAGTWDGDNRVSDLVNRAGAAGRK